jgi:ribonuclease J
VHRIQQVVDAAVELDRKVALVGRSMRKNFNIASNLGIADAPDGLLIRPKEIEDFPDHRVIAISTGSQGEPLSALRRMAFNDHRDVELHSGDTVIFSASPIPGNERSVNETVDRIYEIGARVVTAADAPIHVSGHGSREELKLMLNLTRPRYVFPFHGDYKRISLHAELAEAVGIEPERIFKGRNGLPLEITDGEARFGADRHAGMIFVDGVEIGDPDDVALRDRRMLSADGIFIVVATLDSDDGSQVAAPEVIFRGVPFLEHEETTELVDELREVVEGSLARAADDRVTEPVLLQEDLHDDIAAFVYERLRRRPMILPVVVEV